MKRILLLLVLLSVSATSAQAQPPTKATVVGEVVDETAQPLAGALVTVFDTLWNSVAGPVSADAQGDYVIDSVPLPLQSEYIICAELTGYQTLCYFEVVISLGNNGPINFILLGAEPELRAGFPKPISTSVSRLMPATRLPVRPGDPERPLAVPFSAMWAPEPIRRFERSPE